MYALNNETADAARKAENRTSFIREKGAYVGQFTKAEDIKAGSGTRGVSFSFKGANGEQANFSIYTIKADGTKLTDFGTLMAIMTVLGVRDIKPKATRFTEWDNDQKKMVEVEAPCFPELMNKDIGCLFHMEEYERDDGGIGSGARLNAVYRSQDDLTAAEILDRKAVPEKLEKLIAALRDKPFKKKASGNTSRGGGSHSPDDGGGFSDDIPF